MIGPNLSILRRLSEPFGAAAIIALLVIIGAMTIRNIGRLQSDKAEIEESYRVINAIEDLGVSLKDAETGQRGYLITGNEEYYRAYEFAEEKIASLFNRLIDLTSTDPHQSALGESLRPLIDSKQDELRLAIQTRSQIGSDVAQAIIATDIGKASTDAISDKLELMKSIESVQMAERKRGSQQSYEAAWYTAIFTTLAGLMLVGAVMLAVHRRRITAECDAEKIQFERERLRVTLASIGDGVIVCDAAGKITFQNSISESLTGWPSHEALGKEIESVFQTSQKGSLQRVENPIYQAIRQKRIVELSDQTVLTSKQGQQRPIDDSASPIRDSGGNVIGAVLVYRDVSERHEKERREREESEMRQRILDSLSEYVMVLDENRCLVTVNQAFLNAFDLERDQVAGLAISEAAGGQWNLPAIHHLLDQVARDDSRDHVIELTHRFSDASPKVLRIRGNRFHGSEGVKEAVLLVASDLTDKRGLEERNRQLDQHIHWFLEQIHDYAIFMMDNEHRATTWNLGVLQVLGFEEHEFLGRDVRPLIFTDEAIAAGTVEPEFEKASATGSASDDRWMKRKDGTYFWASGITSSIRDQAGHQVGYSKVMRDMTMQKQIGDELAGLAAQLSEESRRKNEFLATLAHELRNPLAPIKNAVQLMSMMEVSDDMKDLRDIMARQVEQLVRLIDDLMDISRIGRGKVTLNKQFIDVKSIIDAAVESSQPLIDENGQELIVSTPSDEICVNADPARLTQVLSNLLNNASKYSGADCKIELTTTIDNDQVVISVRDNGSGIAPEKLGDIFEMFLQVGNSVERGSAGLGIGLTLVKTLVELHGGTVKVHSDGVGLGSEFVVTLPISDSTPFAATNHTSAPEASGRSFKILVVEDMRSLAIILARLLSKLGHEVKMVDNGQAAIEALQTYAADVVFSDISMPGMTGYELARLLRSQPSTSEITLVAMTGYGQASDRDKALQAGFDEHMIKPVDIAHLQAFFANLSSELQRS